MDVREVVARSLEGTPLEVIACFSLREGDSPVAPVMPRARAVVAVGARSAHPEGRALAELLLRVDVALARARVGSRRIDPQAALLPRIFDPVGVWLVDVDVRATGEPPLLKTA
jgi:hypothetical protein